MKIDLVFLIVLGFVVAYIFMLHKVETMADVGSLDQIKAAVKEIYLADVEAIRNLSNVATKLQAGGLTVPGKMTLSGPMVINNPDQQDKLIVYKNGDANPPYMYYNKQGTLGVWNGKASPWNIDENGTVNAGTVVLNTGIQNPNGQLRVSNQGIMFGGPNTDREVNSGQISAGLHIANSLNIVGMSGDKGAASRRVDMWAEGGLNVYGPIKGNQICLGGTCIDESHLQMLTGARGVSLKHLSGGHLTELADKPWVHAGQDRVLTKWYEASKSNFALFKN